MCMIILLFKIGALEKVLKDDDFNLITTTETREAQEAAKKMLKWIAQTTPAPNLYDRYPTLMSMFGFGPLSILLLV